MAMASNEIDDPPPQLKAQAAFLIRRHSDQLRSIALSSDPKLHYSLYVDFAELMDDDPPLAQSLFSQPTDHLRLFDDAALWAHQIVLGDLKGRKSVIEKKFIHVRINVSGSPLECPETFPRIGSVRVKHRGILLTLKGTVIRSGAIKMYEGERWYICQKCKHKFLVYPELESRNSISLPSFCPSQDEVLMQKYPRGTNTRYVPGTGTPPRLKSCEGMKFTELEESVIRHDYQEIKIQESTQVLGVGAIPRSIPVILKDDLVDIVKAGGKSLWLLGS
ncbi:probable DNA helicase MCM9 isoform X3 [Fagus crenata]